MGKHLSAWERSEVERLHKEGLTHREVGEQLGYERIQIREYFKRLYRKERLAVAGILLKRKGRPRKNPLTLHREYELRIRDLERENELLRSFLHAAGRR